ncbi:UTRA domain-containing protein [Microbispora bryophytorum]|uniref:UTRA domain-containing protein n=1 Tax=Microbispora bryophytorum TaxID=1460882 RepID=UPI0033FB6DF2
MADDPDALVAPDIVSAQSPLAAEARELALPPGSLAITIQRTYYEDTRPVETADIVVPVDRHEIVYDIPIRGEP